MRHFARKKNRLIFLFRRGVRQCGERAPKAMRKRDNARAKAGCTGENAREVRGKGSGKACWSALHDGL